MSIVIMFLRVNRPYMPVKTAVLTNRICDRYIVHISSPPYFGEGIVVWLLFIAITIQPTIGGQ